MSDRESKDKGVERLWTSLRKDLSRLGADLHTAEDVAQETWLIATHKPPVDRDGIRRWLRVVGTRLFWQSANRERARSRVELVASRERPSSTEDESSAEAEVLARLRRCVRELPEPYHTALRMRFFEDREVEEIARLLAVSKWTVHTRIQRGVAKLRTRMGASAERRRSRGYFLVWLRGLRSRPALRALCVAGLGLVGLGLLVAWRSLSSSRYRPDLERSESIAFARQPETPGSVGNPVLRNPITAEEETPLPWSLATHFAGTTRKPDGEPLAGAVVHSTARDGSRPESTVISGEDGRYEIDASGDLLWAGHAEWRDSTRCYLPSAPAGEDLDLVLGPLRSAVEILVTTHDGVPVPEADILVDCGKKEELLQTPRGTLEYSSGPPAARTDAEGRAKMRFPDVEIADLTVLAAGLPFWNEEVTLSEAGNRLEIRLPRPISMSGICEDAEGRPYFHARVQVVQHFGRFVRSAETDAEGRFLVDGLTPGAFVLRAQEEDVGARSARHEGVLSPDASQPLRLELSPVSTLYGRVVEGGSPVEGARVLLAENKPVPADHRVWSTITDARGRFRLGGCGASSGYLAVIHPPGSDQPCVGPLLRPGRAESFYTVLDESTQRAPIEAEFVGATGFVPRLVEFRRDLPPLSVVVVADPPGSRRFRSPPQPEGDYRIVGWNPDLGACQQEVRHDPGAPIVHTFPMPEGGTLSAKVALPEGVRREAVELFVPTLGFNRQGPLEKDRSRRILPWSEEHGAFVGILPLGTHLLSLRGGGLAEDHTMVEILPGTNEVRLAPHRGVEVTLVFQSNPPSLVGPGMPLVEMLDLELFTPTGVVKMSLSGLDHHLVEDGFEFTVWIPTSTVELQARSRPGSEKRAVAVLRAGGRRIEPGELEEGTPRPRLHFELHDLPGLWNIKAPRR